MSGISSTTPFSTWMLVGRISFPGLPSGEHIRDPSFLSRTEKRTKMQCHLQQIKQGAHACLCARAHTDADAHGQHTDRQGSGCLYCPGSLNQGVCMCVAGAGSRMRLSNRDRGLWLGTEGHQHSPRGQGTVAWE